MQRVRHQHAVETVEWPGEDREVPGMTDDGDVAVPRRQSRQRSRVLVDRMHGAAGGQERREGHGERPVAAAEIGPHLRAAGGERRMRDQRAGILGRQASTLADREVSP